MQLTLFDIRKFGADVRTPPAADNDYIAKFRARFELNVDRSPGLGPNGDCHLWTGKLWNRRGRTTFKSTLVYAYRAAWFLAAGRWPLLDLLHSCDEPACVRIEHLREGTQADNVRDRDTRGRGRYGPNAPGRRT